MILERLVCYALGAALAASVVWGLVHGHNRYLDGTADERAHWAEVIRKTNATIDRLNASVTQAKAERDAALDLPIQTITETKIVALPVDVVKQCSYPDAVRRALNAINVKGEKKP